MWDHLSLNSGQGIRFGPFTMLPCCKLPCTFHVIVYIFSDEVHGVYVYIV